MALHTKLQNTPADERARLKGLEIAKIDFRGEYISSQYGVKIEITEINAIEGGVEVFARAWKGNKQLGFGKDGSVDIERFRIINPPILVDDPNGDIIRSGGVDSITGKKQPDRKLREDPKEAIGQSLAHTISLVGKDGANIVNGKVGNTTSTFYPNAGATTAPVDGEAKRQGVNETFSTIRDATGSATEPSWMTDTESSGGLFFASTTTNQFQRVDRGLYGFDIDIGTDAVDSATISFFGTAKDSGLGGAMTLDVTTVTPTNNDTTATFVSGDYEVAKYGTTKLATGIAYSAWSTVAYNDFALNATGEAYIANGIKYFAARNAWDIDNSFGGTWGSSEFIRVRSRMADQTGTANDPKLVVVHSAAAVATGRPNFLTLLGVS